MTKKKESKKLYTVALWVLDEENWVIETLMDLSARLGLPSPPQAPSFFGLR